MILDCRSESTFPGFFVGFGRISENAVCQGQPSHRDPGKHVKTAFARVANARSTLGNPLKIYISQGRARPNHPWQPPQNLHLPGSTFPSPKLHLHPLHTFIMVLPHPFPFPKTGHDQTLQPSSKTPPTTSKHKIPPPNPLIARDKFDTMG